MIIQIDNKFLEKCIFMCILLVLITHFIIDITERSSALQTICILNEEYLPHKTCFCEIFWLINCKHSFYLKA